MEEVKTIDDLIETIKNGDNEGIASDGKGEDE